MKNQLLLALVGLTLTLTACGSQSGGKSTSTAVLDTKSESTMVEGASPTTDGSSSKLLKAPTQDFGSMDPTPPKETGPEKRVEPKPKSEVGAGNTPPETIDVHARAQEMMTVKPTSVGTDKLVSSLTASLKIEKIEPKVENSILNLADIQDATIVIPEIGKCELTVRNFDMKDAGKTVAFHLIGIDPKAEPSPDGCLVKLSTMAMSGFVVEFKNVRLGGPLSETFVPTVRLSVAPVSADPQK
jgi:hypothetical protein